MAAFVRASRFFTPRSQGRLKHHIAGAVGRAQPRLPRGDQTAKGSGNVSGSLPHLGVSRMCYGWMAGRGPKVTSKRETDARDDLSGVAPETASLMRRRTTRQPTPAQPDSRAV
jgi:hypothetical protein